MTRFLRCALCAAAPFALLSATAVYAIPSADAADPADAAAADDYALPDAPTLTLSPNECGGGAIRRPVLLRKTDLPDLDEFVETSLTLNAERPVADARAIDALEHELRRPAATEGLRLADADGDTCDNGIARAAMLQPVAPPKAPHRT